MKYVDPTTAIMAGDISDHISKNWTNHLDIRPDEHGDILISVRDGSAINLKLMNQILSIAEAKSFTCIVSPQGFHLFL